MSPKNKKLVTLCFVGVFLSTASLVIASLLQDREQVEATDLSADRIARFLAQDVPSRASERETFVLDCILLFIDRGDLAESIVGALARIQGVHAILQRRHDSIQAEYYQLSFVTPGMPGGRAMAQELRAGHQREMYAIRLLLERLAPPGGDR